MRETGGRYTSITSSSISWIFTFADFICLVIQGIGGGITGTSNDWDTFNHGIKIMAIGVVVQREHLPSRRDTADTPLVAVTAIFIVIFAEFAWRYKTNRPATRQRDLLFWAKWLRCCGRRKNSAVTNWEEEKEGEPAATEPSRRLMWIAQGVLAFATILIIIRSVYRAIELLSLNHENKSSSIYYDQPAFIALDAAMMVGPVVVSALTTVYPRPHLQHCSPGPHQRPSPVLRRALSSSKLL